MQCTDEDMAKDRTEGLPEPMTFQADANSRRKKGVQRPVFAEVFQVDGVSADLPKKVHLMVNPYAGKKKGRDVAKRVIELVEQVGVEVECSYSAYSGHLVTVASALVVGENEVIAVVGGDGSLSEVISGRMLLGTSRKETFALIPAGTGNSHAHDLGLSTVEAAVEAMLHGHQQAIDLAKVELIEGLPGSTGERMVRYSHNLVTWGLGVDSTIQAEKCDGWVLHAMMWVSCWPSLPIVVERPRSPLTTVSSPTTSRSSSSRTPKRAAQCYRSHQAPAPMTG